MRRIILPQALKRMMPALTNRAIEIFKMTTLASAIAYVELLQQGKLIASLNFNPIEAYTAVAVIFFVFLWPLVQLTYVLERRLGEGRMTILGRLAASPSASAHNDRSARHRSRREAAASASPSSAPPARARAPCCAASTSWRCRRRHVELSTARRSAARRSAGAYDEPS